MPHQPGWPCPSLLSCPGFHPGFPPDPAEQPVPSGGSPSRRCHLLCLLCFWVACCQLPLAHQSPSFRPSPRPLTTNSRVSTGLHPARDSFYGTAIMSLILAGLQFVWKCQLFSPQRSLGRHLALPAPNSFPRALWPAQSSRFWCGSPAGLLTAPSQTRRPSSHPEPSTTH